MVRRGSGESLKWYSHTATHEVLSSTFLNRGWLAEYILLITPFILIGFIYKEKSFLWKLLLLSTLIIFELTLILAGKAYVDDQSSDLIKETRGTLNEPGKNSPFRDRSIEENVILETIYQIKLIESILIFKNIF